MSEASSEVFPLTPGHPLCRGTTPTGPCRVAVSAPGQFCWFHDPNVSAETKTAARRRGAASANLTRQAKAVVAPPNPITPPPSAPAPVLVDTGPLVQRIAAATTPDDLTTILTEVASMVAGGSMPPKTGSVIGALVKIALETQRASFHRRLDEIEQSFQQHHPELAARTPRRRRS